MTLCGPPCCVPCHQHGRGSLRHYNFQPHPPTWQSRRHSGDECVNRLCTSPFAATGLSRTTCDHADVNKHASLFCQHRTSLQGYYGRRTRVAQSFNIHSPPFKLSNFPKAACATERICVMHNCKHMGLLHILVHRNDSMQALSAASNGSVHDGPQGQRQSTPLATPLPQWVADKLPHLIGHLFQSCTLGRFQHLGRNLVPLLRMPCLSTEHVVCTCIHVETYINAPGRDPTFRV